jgi:hypothetical protein
MRTQVRLIGIVCAAILLTCSVTADAQTLAATPPMGWNSWNFFAGKVTDKLSIIHKLNSDHDSQFYVGEPGHSPPDDGVARWRIVGAIEIAA